MQNKRKATIAGVALLVSLSLLFASTPVVKSWGGNLKPLLQAYYWSSNNTLSTGWFYNSSTGVGVVGDSDYWIGVYGIGGTGSNDYGGYFTGYEGVRGNASGYYGYGTWGTASGSYGIGAVGIGTYYVGVYGRGGTSSGDYGGYFYGFRGVYGQGTGSGVQGVYGYTSASTGEGVRGTTAGYGGDGVTATASSSYGYGADAYASGYAGYGLRAQATGTSAYGAYIRSTSYRGMYANGASGYYDAYFPDAIYAGSYWTSGTGVMGIIALNGGSEALEPGDLVAFSGMTAAAEGSSEPMMAVQKVNDANSGAIIGVVQAAYAQEDPVTMQPSPTAGEVALAAIVQKEDVVPQLGITEGEEPPPPLPQPEAIEVAPELAAPSAQQAESLMDAEVGHFVEGAAESGQYVAIVIQGIARVKVDASAAPVRAGEMLVASPAGYAIAASQQREASQPREGSAESGDREVVPGGPPPSQAVPGMTIGRALESLETGTGTIYVFVSVR
jgi:hypothetical protein